MGRMIQPFYKRGFDAVDSTQPTDEPSRNAVQGGREALAGPLDSLDKNDSSQIPDPRKANFALADRLDPIDSYVANSLRLCGDGSMICHKRWCPRCVQARTARLAFSYRARLDRMTLPHHLTLTSYPVECLTRPALDGLRARFKLWRRRAIADPQVNITGGVANIEIDVDSSGLKWLLGLHAVIDAPVAPSESWVREAWQALGGGQQVRLDPITPGTATRTFAYSTKAPDLPANLPMLRQYINSTRGFRQTVAFGSVHPLSGKSPRLRARPASESAGAPTVPTSPAEGGRQP